MIPADLSLKGKVVMVAGNGFQAVSLLSSYLAEAGADLVITCEDKDALKEAEEKIKPTGQKVLPFNCSAADTLAVNRVVDEAVASMGKIDVLINSFNHEFARPFFEISEKEWRGIIDYNLTSTYIFTSAAGRHMLRQKEGSIVSLASGLAERGLSNCAAYCASQGGIVQFSRALALELARENIRVNAIEVGWIESSAQSGKSNESLAHYIPLRRLGKADDIGGLLVYLASPASSYITGQAYRIDGGIMAHG